MASNRAKHLPSVQLDDVNGNSYTGQTMRKIRGLWGKGLPKDIDELRERINGYFDYCEQNDLRPGVEGMALALGTNRTTLWNWCKREGEWGELCRSAKQLIIMFLEDSNQTGHINPASAIFSLKNWAGYQDSVTIEAVRTEDDRKVLKASDLPLLSTSESAPAITAAETVENTLQGFKSWKGGISSSATEYTSVFDEVPASDE